MQEPGSFSALSSSIKTVSFLRPGDAWEGTQLLISLNATLRALERITIITDAERSDRCCYRLV